MIHRPAFAGPMAGAAVSLFALLSPVARVFCAGERTTAGRSRRRALQREVRVPETHGGRCLELWEVSCCIHALIANRFGASDEYIKRVSTPPCARPSPRRLLDSVFTSPTHSTPDYLHCSPRNDLTTTVNVRYVSSHSSTALAAPLCLPCAVVMVLRLPPRPQSGQTPQHWCRGTRTI